MAPERPTPFFATDGQPPARGRLLLVSWHFPPAQSTGALRWQKLSRYGTERGWGLDVISLAPSDAGLVDEASLSDLPAGTRVFGVSKATTWEQRVEHIVWRAYRRLRPRLPSGAASTSSQVSSEAEALPPGDIRWRLRPRDLFRAWTAYLEFRRDGAWAGRVVELAETLGQTTEYAAVISCGPPHLAHTAARRIAQSLGIPLILDFRDPFSFLRRFPAPIASPLWFTLARRHERPAIAAARLVIANTEALRRALAGHYPEAASKLVTVMNGCDEEPIGPLDRDRFLVVYAGALYLDRDPTTFLRAAATVVQDLELRPDEFGIEFVGQTESYGGVRLESIAAGLGLQGYVRVTPRLPREEALRHMARATTLLNLPQDSAFAIPSKIFEYMCFDAWLLVLAAADTPTELLLRDSGAVVVAPQDASGITAALRHQVEAFRRGERPTRLALDPRFTRRHQATLLFDALDRALGVRS